MCSQLSLRPPNPWYDCLGPSLPALPCPTGTHHDALSARSAASHGALSLPDSARQRERAAALDTALQRSAAEVEDLLAALDATSALSASLAQQDGDHGVHSSWDATSEDGHAQAQARRAAAAAAGAAEEAVLAVRGQLAEAHQRVQAAAARMQGAAQEAEALKHEHVGLRQQVSGGGGCLRSGVRGGGGVGVKLYAAQEQMEDHSRVPLPHSIHPPHTHPHLVRPGGGPAGAGGRCPGANGGCTAGQAGRRAWPGKVGGRGWWAACWRLLVGDCCWGRPCSLRLPKTPTIARIPPCPTTLGSPPTPLCNITGLRVGWMQPRPYPTLPTHSVFLCFTTPLCRRTEGELAAAQAELEAATQRKQASECALQEQAGGLALGDSAGLGSSGGLLEGRQGCLDEHERCAVLCRMLLRCAALLVLGWRGRAGSVCARAAGLGGGAAG